MSQIQLEPVEIYDLSTTDAAKEEQPQVRIVQNTIKGVEYYHGIIEHPLHGILYQTTRMSETACRQGLAKYLWQIKRALSTNVRSKGK